MFDVVYLQGEARTADRAYSESLEDKHLEEMDIHLK